MCESLRDQGRCGVGKHQVERSYCLIFPFRLENRRIPLYAVKTRIVVMLLHVFGDDIQHRQCTATAKTGYLLGSGFRDEETGQGQENKKTLTDPCCNSQNPPLTTGCHHTA